MLDNIQAIALVTGIIMACFVLLFWALRMVFNNGVTAMKDAIKFEIQHMNKQCKLISGNLHTELVAEKKRSIYADDRIELLFKEHGHKGLDNGGSKVTI